MKAIHTKEYFEKYREELFKRYRKDCDYEHDLSILLPDFSLLPVEVREKAEAVVTKMYAEKVAETAKQELVQNANIIFSRPDMNVTY